MPGPAAPAGYCYNWDNKLVQIPEGEFRATTIAQGVRFEELREELRQLIVDIIEEEFKTVRLLFKKQKLTYFEPNATAEDVWDNVMSQLKPTANSNGRTTWVGCDYQFKGIDSSTNGRVNQNIYIARGPVLLCAYAWWEGDFGSGSFDAISEHSGKEMIEAMEEMKQGLEDGLIACAFDPAYPNN